MGLFLSLSYGCKEQPAEKNEENEVLFKDDFSNPSTLSDNWEIRDAKNPEGGPSKWVIEDEKLKQKSNIFRAGEDEYDFFEGTHAVTKKGNDWKNYEFSVDFSIEGDNDGVGVLFRYIDNEHYYRLITVEDSGNRGPFRRLQVKNGDKYITLAESEKGYDATKSHSIKVKVINDNIDVSFDGENIFSEKDTLYSSGCIGLQAYAEQPVFDNVLVLEAE